MTDLRSDARPIGLFDSGLGGLAVLAAVRRLLPNEALVYLADQAHAPYGGRSADEIVDRCEKITAWLLERDVKAVVVACNTASAAGLEVLRSRFPTTPFVGMEPAVKPAANASRSGVIGVLATAATLRGHRFASLVVRHASGVKVVERPCPGLADLVERGGDHDEEIESMVRRFVAPVLGAGADTLVLGCTHYSLVAPVIARVAGPDVRLVDPSEAVARQVVRVVETVGRAPGAGGDVVFATTGDVARYRNQVTELVGPGSFERAWC